MADSLADAVSRLEVAVERLAVIAARPRAADARAEEVADLSRRLDAALSRLRIALREDADEAAGREDADEADDEGPPAGAREA